MFTTDTRKSYCPIRIAYAGAHVGPFHSHELTDRIYLGNDLPLAVIRGTEYSDYSGSTVEASNHRVLCERFDGQLVQIYGSHGYQALAYDATLGPVPDSEELCDVLYGLEDSYGPVDDDDHSALESELETEAWDDWGRKDFRKTLTALLDEIDPDHEHEIPDDEDSCTAALPAMNWSGAGTWREFLVELWRHGCEEFNVNGGGGCVVETGCTVHFYIAEWVKGWRDMERTNPSVARGRLQADLDAIAKACRTA